jgi:hypothetical protein
MPRGRVSTAVPIYAASIEAETPDGRPLVTRSQPDGDFASITFSLRADAASPTSYWRPTSLTDAASELRSASPPELYRRLIVGFPELRDKDYFVSDPDLTERVFDVARFLDDAWSLNDASSPLGKRLRELGASDSYERMKFVFEQAWKEDANRLGASP